MLHVVQMLLHQLTNALDSARHIRTHLWLNLVPAA